MATSPSQPASASTIDSGALGFKQFQVLGDGSVAQLTTTAGSWGYAPVSTATTTVVDANGPGQLHSIVVVGGTLGAITVYDNTAGSGQVIVPAFTPPTLSSGGAFTITLDVSYSVGLTIVTAAATALVVTYR